MALHCFEDEPDRVRNKGGGLAVTLAPDAQAMNHGIGALHTAMDINF